MALSKSKKIIIIVSSVIILLCIITPIAAYFIANGNAVSKVEDFTKSVKNICDIKYKDVSYNILNRHLTVDNINITCSNEKIMDIKKAEFNHIVSSDPIPASIQVDIKGGVLYHNTNLFSKYGKAISYLGYDNLPFQGRISYTLGKQSKEFKITSLNIVANNLGLLQGSLKINNVYDKELQNIFTNLINNTASFYLTFNDKGLKNKVYDNYSKVTELTVDEIKAKISNAFYKRAVNTDNTTKSNYAQLEKFMLSSDGISIQLHETDNISISNAFNSFDLTGYRKLLNSIKNINLELMAK